ncbi:Vegetative incompatibility protein HET-E-1 [Apiospora arundinis]|uniref:Vegetative incompatibility protein HET-E-1 n=1 Tax=Apiospora arundinis TaxID=335852 RepID=A0ABR2JAC1_9PEZI
MRLLYIETLELQEFNESDVPDYAILSHTWGKEEVSFEDMVKPTPDEFIAPADINFYSKDWSLLFTKENDIRELSTMTGISLEIMLTCDPSLASVAQRMSWAARRVTTRPEDMAYCLLGIFDVNMPMLYGEGRHKAFLRLQEEIMKKSDDQSLFAWRKQEKSYSSYSGLLAPSPKEFVDSHDVAFVDESLEARPYVSTNKGISLRLDLIPYRADINERDVYLAFLDCRYPGPQGKHIGILLKRLDGSQFVRVDAHRIFNQPSRHEPPTTPHSSAGSPNEDERIVAEQASMLRQIIQIKQRIFDDALYERLQKKYDSTMCIVLLRWDKRSGHFSTCCFEDTEFYKDTESWRTSLYNRVEKKLDSVGSPYSEDIDSSQDPEFWRTSISNRVEKLSRLVGNESAESSFKSLERIFRVKVNLQLEMRGDEVVIKASVTVGGIS